MVKCIKPVPRIVVNVDSELLVGKGYPFIGYARLGQLESRSVRESIYGFCKEVERCGHSKDGQGKFFANRRGSYVLTVYIDRAI